MKIIYLKFNNWNKAIFKTINMKKLRRLMISTAQMTVTAWPKKIKQVFKRKSRNNIKSGLLNRPRKIKFTIVWGKMETL